MKKREIVILLLCVAFLFYKYIAQLFPTLIGSELIASEAYDAVMLSVIASSYYYSYAIIQIFSGFIVDRYSIKMPMFLALILIALMLFLFASTHNFYVMCVSRVLMGVGASFATLIYIKCAAHYASPKTFGLISSLLATATMLGAACGGAPVAILFHKMGWRDGLNCVAFVGIFLSVLVLVFQKGNADTKSQVPARIRLSSIREVMNKSDNWLLLLYSGLTFSPVAVLGGLWGTPFLMTKYAVSATDASCMLSTMFIGLAVGAPLWAILSSRLNRKKYLMQTSNIFSMIVLTAIIYGNFSGSISLVLFFLLGFSVSCFMASFELCREINALYLMGLSVAFINSGEGLVGAIIEPLIGHLLDVSKSGPVFTLANYHTALSILPLCFVLSSAALFFIGWRKSAVLYTEYVSA